MAGSRPSSVVAFVRGVRRPWDAWRIDKAVRELGWLLTLEDGRITADRRL